MCLKYLGPHLRDQYGVLFRLLGLAESFGSEPAHGRLHCLSNTLTVINTDFSRFSEEFPWRVWNFAYCVCLFLFPVCDLLPVLRSQLRHEFSVDTGDPLKTVVL